MASPKTAPSTVFGSRPALTAERKSVVAANPASPSGPGSAMPGETLAGVLTASSRCPSCVVPRAPGVSVVIVCSLVPARRPSGGSEAGPLLHAGSVVGAREVPSADRAHRRRSTARPLRPAAGSARPPVERGKVGGQGFRGGQPQEHPADVPRQPPPAAQRTDDHDGEGERHDAGGRLGQE